MPEGHARERIISDAAAPHAMKSFHADPQPHGNFDLDGHPVRPGGSEGRVEMHGVLKPLAARGKCRWFPYEVTDLEGRVRVEGDEIRVEQLVGQHAGAEIRV